MCCRIIWPLYGGILVLSLYKLSMLKILSVIIFVSSLAFFQSKFFTCTEQKYINGSKSHRTFYWYNVFIYAVNIFAIVCYNAKEIKF